MAYVLDKSLAVREYYRHKEDLENQAELIDVHIRRFQLMFAGKNADKSIGDLRLSERFAVKNWKPNTRADSALQENGEEIPWWADDAKYDKWVEGME